MLYRFLILFILGIEITMLTQLEELIFDQNILYYIIILNFFSLFCFIFLDVEKNPRLKNNQLKFSTLFLISFLIVSLQPFLDLALNNLDEENGFLFIRPGLINKTFLYTSIALNSFLVGFSLYQSKKPKIINSTFKDKSIKNINLTLLKILNTGFFILFLSQIDAIFLDSTTYGTGVSNENPLIGYAMLFFDTSFIAMILHIILNRKFQISLKSYISQFGVNIIFFIIYLVLIMLSGDRGPIIYLSLALIFGFIYLGGMKISFGRLVLLILGSSFLVTVLGTIRRTDGKFIGALNNRTVQSVHYENSISPMTKELATSILTVSTAIDNVPSRYDHTYGLFMFQNFSVLIPGFNRYINNEFEIEPYLFSSPRFLTYVYLGPGASWGVGTSSVADIYIDFGLIGVILGFMIFGFLMKKLEVNVLGSNSKKFNEVAIYLLYFSFSIYIARSNLIVPFTKYFYVLFFYYLILLSNKKK